MGNILTYVITDFVLAIMIIITPIFLFVASCNRQKFLSIYRLVFSGNEHRKVRVILLLSLNITLGLIIPFILFPLQTAYEDFGLTSAWLPSSILPGFNIFYMLIIGIMTVVTAIYPKNNHHVLRALLDVLIVIIISVQSCIYYEYFVVLINWT